MLNRDAPWRIMQNKAKSGSAPSRISRGILCGELRGWTWCRTIGNARITTKHCVAELFVQFGIKPQARLLRSELIHDAFSSRGVRASAPLRSEGTWNNWEAVDLRRTPAFPSYVRCSTYQGARTVKIRSLPRARSTHSR